MAEPSSAWARARARGGGGGARARGACTLIEETLQKRRLTAALCACGYMAYVSRRWERRGHDRGSARHGYGSVATHAAGGAWALPAMAVGAWLIMLLWA